MCGVRDAVHHLRARRGRRLIVVKRDGARQEFDRDRLVSGLRKALTRRPVPEGAAETRRRRDRSELRAAGVTEVPSSRIGALAMEQLRGIDQIAYIRFASVYQSFEDLEALKREVDTLYAERGTGSIRQVSVLSDRDIRAALELARVGSTRTTRTTCSLRRSTSTSTRASGSSATTATRSSTCARRSPT